jgi:phosphohistidine phosphatase SixA
MPWKGIYTFIAACDEGILASMRQTLIVRLCVPVILAACLTAWAGEAARTIFIVRHAERAGDKSVTTIISDAGKCRAEMLARILADAGVKSIYVTQFVRTQQTAEPLAKKLGLRPEVIANINDLAPRLQALAQGSTVLVISHESQIPELIKRLGGGTVPPFTEEEFDRLYVVTLAGTGEASVATLRYPGCSQ